MTEFDSSQTGYCVHSRSPLCVPQGQLACLVGLPRGAYFGEVAGDENWEETPRRVSLDGISDIEPEVKVGLLNCRSGVGNEDLLASWKCGLGRIYVGRA